ncbi:Xaa-Pro dipeptidyl-peptidase [Actinokineospora xionganensis]|uniref:Xaa-Pro dipeptidyl-peptidase n=1 Tax=Actinokineospora xionganensis TaxID=2684470 RepID=A0ABR7L7T5_9PSEU|nr:Xaa-Pro dipeptidyl-peptidase [Actinokineospora xionganensis]MBC6448446.1 Xaa-Pro dipeptidyl-peptidase [Actinokineospora xionganensis]
MTIRRSLLTVAAAVGAVLVPLSPAVAEPLESTPVYSYADAVRETVWVDTGLTSPQGARVRVAADIIRPREAQATGVKVPVIMDASPYYTSVGRGNESQKKTYDSAGRPIQFPLFYDNYFVPRGYAIVLVDLSGTARSNGCVDVGGRSEVASAKAVVDWLNGRATGYTSATGSTRASASWSSGAVGMIGKSWDGTIANGVAATGVDGLKTIVAIGAISSWYDYYRAHGATLTMGTPSGLASRVENSAAATNCATVKSTLDSGSPSSGDLTAMWRERDYVPDAANVKASMFVVHGVNDLNVKSINFGQWWNALPATVERKIWLTQAGHVDPFDFRRAVWVDTLHRWFDHYLMGIDNGIQNEPRSTVEHQPDAWKDDVGWPVVTTPKHLYAHASSTAGVGTLSSAAPPPTEIPVWARFTDNRGSEYTWVSNPTSTSSARLIYSSPALTADNRVSGTPRITITATSSSSAARLTAVLVDLGPSTIRYYRGSGEGITTLATRSCWGESATGDSACFLDTATNKATTSANIISRGWADLGHHASLDSRKTLSPNTPYKITFNLASTDQVIPAGHKLALVIGSTDSAYIGSVGSYPKLAVDLTKTVLQIPMTGSF